MRHTREANLEQQCVVINAVTLAKLSQCEINYYAAREQGDKLSGVRVGTYSTIKMTCAKWGCNINNA
jgi:hypothetical protein